MNDESPLLPTGRFLRVRSRVAGAVAAMAMGSWVVLAAIPMVVAIMALT